MFGVFLFVSLPTFTFTRKARNEFFRVEDNLEIFFLNTTTEGSNCDDGKVFSAINLSYISTITFSVPLLLCLIITSLGLYFGYEIEEIEGESNFIFIFILNNAFGVVLMSTFVIEPLLTLLYLPGLREQIVCLNGEKEFESLRNYLKGIIIIDSIIVSIIFILTLYLLILCFLKTYKLFK